MDKFTFKIGGEAGFGIVTTGLVFAKIASRLGYHVFDYIEYPSLIRGGHNAYESVVGQEEVWCLKEKIDYLVCLNEDTFKFHKDRLGQDAIVIYDPEDFEAGQKMVGVSVPFKKILRELGGQMVMKNTIALGAILAILGTDLIILDEIIKQQFEKKGQAVIDFNINFAKKGFDYIIENYKDKIKPLLAERTKDEKLVVSGNDSFSLGAVIANCGLYCAYPMTPSSSVLSTLASWQDKAGMVVRHAEDEISVINTGLGASFAGVRSAVGTSGGGFALMVESISYAGIAEIPIVIFLSQRPGPATGMPTWTEQGDLLFTVHAGHGEFPKIVLAPGDQKEMYELTAKAFNLADIYQTPVIVMSDMLLSESHKTIRKQELDTFNAAYSLDRGKTVVTSTSPYLRYKDSDDGISPRLLPGVNGAYYQANSYEHLEDSHTTEGAAERRLQVNKRSRKMMTYLVKHFAKPVVYGDLDAAKTVLVAWGSTKGVLLESQKILKDTAIIHFNHLFPLKTEDILPLFGKDKRYILVENNSHGQFGKLLRMETGVNLEEKLLKYDGRQFWVEEIVNFVNNHG